MGASVNAGAYERLLGLLEESDLSAAAVDCLLAAADGEEALAAHLAGTHAPPEHQQPSELTTEPAQAFLQEIAVEGFRGVGPRARLQFEPGPGLTLVVGRNGSGKSSFAEGLEVLLTGTSLRWADKTKVWQEGWRNLHHAGPAAISAKFHLDGEREPLTLTRAWAEGARLDDGWPPAASGPCGSWSQLGWEVPLEQFRPILSYNELGTMFSSRAAALYEALSAVLGLESFDATLAVLRQGRLARERTGKDEKVARDSLGALLAESNDDRATAAGELLAKRKPDAEAVLACAGEDRGARSGNIRALAAVELPSEERIASLFDEIESSRARIAELALGDADRLDALAGLLEVGLAYQHDHGGPPPADCPLCGAEQRLDESWALRAQAEATDLRTRSREFRDARGRHAERLREVRERLFWPLCGRALEEAREAGLDVAAASDLWQRWISAAGSPDPEFIEHARIVAPELRMALEHARGAALAEQGRREDAWRPLRDAILEWHSRFRQAERDAQVAATIKTAETWLSGALVELRRERLAPVVDAAKANWAELRHESDIALGNVELRKQGMQRFAAFDVVIEGADASAFGVMSQGELSALAISVFLPRAMLPGSPFGFMVIDDPVQSMDPAKVDGLARVLARAAAERQVIVFTHDERLPQAIRRLAIEARIMQVQRRGKSRVEIVASRPPSDRYIGEAIAIAKATELPADVRARVIPGFCRSAIEAACATRIRRCLLGHGLTHGQIDERLDGLTTLGTWLAEAFELPVAKGHELRDRIARLGGPGAVRVFELARRGSHDQVDIDALELAEGAKRLVRAIEREQ